MPRPLDLTTADLTASERTGGSLSASTGALSRLGSYNAFAQELRDLDTSRRALEMQKSDMRKEKRRQPIADLAGIAVGGGALGLGASPALAALAGEAGGGLIGGTSPHPLVSAGVGAIGGYRDLEEQRALAEEEAALRRRRGY